MGRAQALDFLFRLFTGYLVGVGAADMSSRLARQPTVGFLLWEAFMQASVGAWVGEVPDVDGSGECGALGWGPPAEVAARSKGQGCLPIRAPSRSTLKTLRPCCREGGGVERRAESSRTHTREACLCSTRGVGPRDWLEGGGEGRGRICRESPSVVLGTLAREGLFMIRGSLGWLVGGRSLSSILVDLTSREPTCSVMVGRTPAGHSREPFLGRRNLSVSPVRDCVFLIVTTPA